MRAEESSLADRITEYVKPAIESGGIVGLTVGVIDAREDSSEFKLPDGAEAPKIDGARTLVLGFGKANDARDGAPAADTLFEIGSITKVFTSLLLAEMVERKLLKLDDPVESLLPADVKVPAHGERKITLIDLATHTSALPRMPSNFAPADVNNPFADYTPEQLYKALADIKLKREPGKRYDYSNLGVGLLGHALALKSGKSYEQLVTDEILGPLGMKNTQITRDDAQRAHSASGHDADGGPAHDWDIATLTGAGALRSTSGDMLRFLAAEMGILKTPLRTAMFASQEIRLATKAPPGSIACGWHVALDGALRWHNGQTGG
ncbi:MAG TPA: serine hydrolase domain-containing protein, partial [Pirellulales bacterium]